MSCFHLCYVGMYVCMLGYALYVFDVRMHVCCGMLCMYVVYVCTLGVHAVYECHVCILCMCVMLCVCYVLYV